MTHLIQARGRLHSPPQWPLAVLLVTVLCPSSALAQTDGQLWRTAAQTPRRGARPARVEWRNLFYNEGMPTSSTVRFRNRLEFVLPLNKENLAKDGVRYLTADWEWFFPLDDPAERFANKQRIRAGSATAATFAGGSRRFTSGIGRETPRRPDSRRLTTSSTCGSSACFDVLSDSRHVAKPWSIGRYGEAIWWYGNMVNMVKVTFTLDDETVARLRLTAERLRKPQSRVVREAVAEYAAAAGRLSEAERRAMLDAFDRVVPAIPQRPAADVRAEVRTLRNARRRGGRRSPAAR